MNDEPGARALPGASSSASSASSAAARRRTEMFGDVMPVTSSDERPETWGEEVADSDEALRREVPPHHG